MSELQAIVIFIQDCGWKFNEGKGWWQDGYECWIHANSEVARLRICVRGGCIDVSHIHRGGRSFVSSFELVDPECFEKLREVFRNYDS